MTRLRDLITEVGLGVGLQLAEDERGDLLRGEGFGLIAGLHLDVGVAVFAFDDLEGHIGRLLLHFRELAADKTLGGENCITRVGDRLTLGRLPDEAFACLGKSDNRRSGTSTLSVGDHHRLAAFHDGHTGVGGTEIDA